MQVFEWPIESKPHYRLRRVGPEGLSESELLAILIGYGSSKKTGGELAKEMLQRHGCLREVLRLSQRELMCQAGISEKKAATLVAAFELTRRMQRLAPKHKLKVNEPEVVFEYYEPILGHLKQERFLVLILNSANHLVRDITISEGILNSSLVHPREVFKAAVLESAASIILLHNHPSGAVKPSTEDESITRRLVEVGQIMNIPVLDHIIIAAGKFYSFREAGLIG